MASWKWFDGWNTWSQWVPVANIIRGIKGLKEGKYYTPIGTINFGSNPSDVVNELNGTSAVNQQYVSNLDLQHDAQTYNSSQAQIQRDWEERMSNTEVQRRMNDIKAAGLNPWLAVQGTASTPSAAVASTSANQVSQRNSGAETIGQLASTAVSAAIIAKIISKVVK